MGKFKMIRHLFAGAMLAFGLFAASSVASAEDSISVTFPTERGIFQRDFANVADVTVEAKCETFAKVEAQIVDSSGEAVVGWTQLIVDVNDNTKYTGVLENVPAGGWYDIEVRAKDMSTSNVIATGSVSCIGVGEVFITGGQSNSCNFGGTKMTAGEDIVSAFDAATGKWQHCEDVQPNLNGYHGEGGSPWPTLGDALVAELGVPVGFVATGNGNTKISELLTKEDLWATIKNSIEALKPYGFKAFLIHQGEADEGTDREEYKASYLELIQETRKVAGFDLPWVVAKVSYAWSGYNNPENSKSLTDAQKAICNNYNIFEGPTTDDLQGEYRHTDNLHMSELGLVEHGNRWAEVLINKLYTGYKVNQADTMTNGKLALSKESYYGNEEVTVTVEPAWGYTLKEGSVVVNGGAVEVVDNKFIMPAEDVTVEAEFVQLPQYFLDLGNVIKNAEAINANDYEAAGITQLNKVVAEAKKVFGKHTSTEEEVKAASAKVTSAVAALVKKTVAPVPTAAPAPTQAPPAANTDAPLPAKGLVVTKSGLKFKVMASTDTAKTVSVVSIVNKKKTSITIPKTVTIDGYTYNVVSIEKKAFANAKKLKKITIKSTYLKSVGKNAFKGVHAKVKIKVPKSKLKAYKKLFKGKGLKSSAKITK